MTSIKKIKEKNDQQFLTDLKNVREVMMYAHRTGTFFRIKKGDILKAAETDKITYYLTDKIFVVKRMTMIVQ